MNPSTKKILLVEDEDFIRELYVRQLTKAGFQVKAAPDGTSGLNLLMSEPFDLVLLDIMLPGMNGLQLLREYKTKNPTSSTIVILLTNLGQEAVIKEGFELGAQAYIIKASYTPDQVVNEVKNALENQGTAPNNGISPTTSQSQSMPATAPALVTTPGSALESVVPSAAYEPNPLTTPPQPMPQTSPQPVEPVSPSIVALTQPVSPVAETTTVTPTVPEPTKPQ